MRNISQQIIALRSQKLINFFLIGMFDKFLTVTTLMCRPVSWSESSCLVRERRVQYRCYSQLNHYIRDPATQPYSAPISCTSNTESRSEEKEKEGEECPQSSLAQCTCDLELELSGDLRLS